MVNAKLNSRTLCSKFFYNNQKVFKKNAELDAAFEYIEKFGKSYWK